VGITGFQLFWLKENFDKEKRNLELLANTTFRETVKKLQAKKLNLDKVFNDTTGKIHVEIMKDRHPGPEELAGALNDVTVRVNDSMTRENELPEPPGIFLGKNISITGRDTSQHKTGKMVISMSESYSGKSRDSIHEINFQGRSHPGEIIRFLYSVDSLQDSLRVSEIDSACKIAFRKEGLVIPFTVKKSDSIFHQGRMNADEPAFRNKITIGFSHPVTYEVHTGNAFTYLMKKLTSPVLFSVFLISITILSFVLLYRNLLKQKKLTEIKNEFISNITHELKTPIATVGVAIEALRNFNAINNPQRTKEYLDISQNELHRLSLLVDKVLKLSMFEKKEVDLKYEPVNMKDIVEEVVSSMKLQIEKNHAAVTVNQEGDTSLQGDRLHLVSVIYNLLDNALKYGNGNIAIKIEMKEAGDQVILNVSDNGVGIPPEYKEKVFEKFFRIPSGDKHNTKGYGLGLSYVAHVIKKHNGKIEVESQPGLGTKFIIILPKFNA